MVSRASLPLCQQHHAYASISIWEEDACGSLEDMWQFARSSCCPPSAYAAWDDEDSDAPLYIFCKHDSAAAATVRNHHRMLLAIFRDRFVLVDVRMQKQTCKIEIVTEVCNVVRIEHLLMDGPMSSWYHPCCNEEMSGTCEEAMEHMRDCIMWECIHTPPQMLHAWDDERTLAFAMSQHARVAGDSCKVPRNLDCHILRKIFGNVQREPAPCIMSTFQLLDWMACLFYGRHFANICPR